MPEDWQLGKISPDLLDNTPFSYEVLAASTTSDVNCSTNGNGPVAMEVDLTEEKAKPILNELGVEMLKEPLYIEFIRFLNLLLQQSLDKDSTCRALVALTVLEQIVLFVREDSHKFLQFVPFHLLDDIVRDSYDILTFEQFLAYFCLDSATARKTAAYLLCQLQTSKAHHL